MKYTQTRCRYQALLRSSIGNEAFYKQIAHLLDNDPYFMPGHLEMLWNAEERGDYILYRHILSNALRYAMSVLLNTSVRRHAEHTWSQLEKNALTELLVTATQYQDASLPTRIRARLGVLLAHDYLRLKTIQSTIESHDLRLIRTVDVSRCLGEIRTVAPYWWQINTTRQERISHHRHTWSIIIRERVNKVVPYAPADGVHESLATVLAYRFPLIHAMALDLAQELGIGLGKTAIVMLKSHAQAYRHFDAETHYAGRDRYHLILQAGKENILASGQEIINAQPGELWYFNNHVMHRAQNRSDVDRIHLIFDGYPLRDHERFANVRDESDPTSDQITTPTGDSIV